MNFNQRAIEFIAATALDIRAGDKKYLQSLPSPCMSVCQMDEVSGLCQGCLRSIDEIVTWSTADEAFKRKVWSDIDARAQRLLQADGSVVCIDTL